jgi:hypothetical protein
LPPACAAGPRDDLAFVGPGPNANCSIIPTGLGRFMGALSHLVQRCQCTARILCLRSNYWSCGEHSSPAPRTNRKDQ